MKASHPLKDGKHQFTEVLHTLLWTSGANANDSINGKKYVLVIVDDYTPIWIESIYGTELVVYGLSTDGLKVLVFLMNERTSVSTTGTALSKAKEPNLYGAARTMLIFGKLTVPWAEASSHCTLVILMIGNTVRSFSLTVMCLTPIMLLKTGSEAASSSHSVIIDVTSLNNQLPHVQKWTQAHSLENIIGDKDRPVSTRKGK
ncbi:hypothetical protein Tco_1430011 [Tanacetum coccineum]